MRWFETGRIVKDAINVIIDAIADPMVPPAAREAAANDLGRIGQFASKAVPRVCEIIQTRGTPHAVCKSLLKSLPQLGTDPTVAMPTLVTFLRTAGAMANDDFVDGAMEAIFRIDPDGSASDLVSVLIELLKNSSSRVQTLAADGIGRLGSRAEHATPVLIETLPKLLNNALFSATTDAIRKVNPSAGNAVLVPALIKALNGTRPARKCAWSMLGDMGIDAKDAYPAPQKATRRIR